MNTVATESRQTTRWFHALSDETRLEILRLLSGGERALTALALLYSRDFLEAREP
jgi:chromosome segregation ATPase